MVNLRNVLVRNDTSAYLALAEIVAICGLENVLAALSEITAEQYLQRIESLPNLTETHRKIVVSIDGRHYTVAPAPGEDR